MQSPVCPNPSPHLLRRELNLKKSFEKASGSLGIILFFVLMVRTYIGYFTNIFTLWFSVFLLLTLPFAFNIKQFKGIAFLLVGSLSLYVINKNIITLYLIFSFVYIFRNQNIAKLGGFIFICNTIFISIVLILVYNGILIDEISQSRKGYAHTLGFDNPNPLGLFGFYSIIAYYLWMIPRSKLLTLIGTVLINEAFYQLTCSRTSWMAGIVLVICTLFYIARLYKDWTKFFVASLPIILTCVVYYILLHPEEFGALNILLSKRISILGGLLETMSKINILFGMPVEGEPVDCAYVGLLFSGGIFSLLLFLYCYWKTVWDSYGKIISFIPVLIAVLISGLGESTFSSPAPSIILFWLIIFKFFPSSKKSKKKIAG